MLVYKCDIALAQECERDIRTHISVYVYPVKPFHKSLKLLDGKAKHLHYI